MAHKNIDEYISSYPEDVQLLLQNIRELVKEVAPDSHELISYNMPTFELGKKRFYFAAFKKHIGFYAIYQPVPFEDEVGAYRSTKDTIQVPLDKPMPYELVKKLIRLKLLD
jgi:uncharacterized protein YdhG (YjbR/CyaY superfamily)